MVPEPGGHSEGDLEALHRDPLNDPYPNSSEHTQAERQLWSARLRPSRREPVI